MSEMLTVTCPLCARYLYSIDSSVIKLGAIAHGRDFRPYAADIPQPRDDEFMECPFCRTNLTSEIDELLYEKQRLENHR